ncbi:urease subunit alpha [Rhodococcus erythropolis]|uniref:urease subunit alpha n=1 Tax=Rhodococcus erythropolis TaxID=1833 RepID=UPI000878CD2A|nr:urease subunit alpha [Rhodococcus erythropolis]OFV75820.1 urease subunit alpha [Rhodococcus erythropolis]
MTSISRQEYSGLFGVTTGDQIRLGNTDLYIEVEEDLRTIGDESIYGGGKTLRDGMGQDPESCSIDGALDLVITNVVIVDATIGVVKADVGIKDGKIVGWGKAGNSSTMEGVTPGLTTGPATDAISGEQMILTAAGIDPHVHLVSPQQAYHALSGGVTTLIGGGIGPTDGTNGTTITSGIWNMEMMLKANEGLPVNVCMLGKGNSSGHQSLVEQIKAGAAGLKVHEDWGATPATIRESLRVADEMDVQVAIHTDTLNEAGYVEDTIAAFEGRTIHTYHSEGAGGGHAPDILRVTGEDNVLPASTNPTLPYGINTQAELFDMIMVCHNLNPKVPSDVSFAESRVRAETIGAENVLQDMGVISMFSSDSQAMGRVGENWLRAIQTADCMKRSRGKLPEDSPTHDNFRVLRYVAKVTINPALTFGLSHVVGSIGVGKMADLVLWEPAFFGAKPKTIIKNGLISWHAMGDPNASLPTPQPVIYRPMFGGFGKALPHSSVSFVSRAALDDGIKDRLGLERQVVAVEGTRTVTKRDLVRNSATPEIKVDPETFAVTADGVHAYVEPAESIRLNQLYFFS